MNRREFLFRLAGDVLKGFQLNRPNICLILADDLGYGNLGCYGQADILTPHLDALAAGGLRFTQAYSPSPVCAPSRWALMTGYHVGQAPTMVNSETILRQETTIAQHLQEAGYTTAIFGKWGLGWPDVGSGPLEKGFDQFLGYLFHNEAWDYYLPYIWQDRTYLPIPANENGQQGLYIPDLLTERALEFISQAQTPFFLYLPFTLPHPNSGLSDAFQVPDDEPYSGKPWSQVEKNYAAMVTRLDSYVGQIIEALPANTLIIFTSDNGSFFPQYFASNGGLRGKKGQLYEGGIRVPLIVSGPGIAPGVETRPAWLVNFGKVALSGNVDYFLEPGLMYWAFDYPQIVEAVRLGGWKGIRVGEMWELYNLADDPGEAVNLAEAQPEMIQQMAAVMDGYCPAPKVCWVRLPMVWK